MSAQGATATVRTVYGDLQGVEVGDARIFSGIPFAAPPVGPLRFAAPVPPSAWQGMRDASRFGATAPQRDAGDELEILPHRVQPGDDFLNLNVWAPKRAHGAPVMVFIHGGSFVTGSGTLSTYDGTAFARDGVVLVTINYRLGAEGFLWTGEGEPNVGLLDQIAALEWVRDNVHAFGGDPARVTVFGESAGAMSVGALLVMPRAKGLFRRAILQSGAGHNASSPEDAVRVARRLAEHLNIEPTLDAFREVPPERLVEGASAISAAVSSRPSVRRWGGIATSLLPFQPVIDGVSVPALPQEAITKGAADDVEILIGSNADEARLFFVPNGAIDRMPNLLAYVFARRYGAKLRPLRRSYRARDAAGGGALTMAVLTDGYYRVPVLEVALAHPHTHVYEFSWRPPTFDGRLGACHAIELPFVFDTLPAAELAALTGQDPPQALADEMHAAWVGFATSGDPGWARFTREGRAAYRFAVTSAPFVDDTVDSAVWPQVASTARA